MATKANPEASAFVADQVVALNSDPTRGSHISKPMGAAARSSVRKNEGLNGKTRAAGKTVTITPPEVNCTTEHHQ